MEPKQINCCMPEPMGNKEFGKMVKGSQTLEEGRVPAKEAKNWIIEGEKKRITRLENRRLSNNFEMEGLMAQTGLWKMAKGKIIKERGEFLNEEGDVVKELKAVHEEDYWSSWLREDERGKEERKAITEKEKKEEKGRGERRERNGDW